MIKVMGTRADYLEVDKIESLNVEAATSLINNAKKDGK